MSPLKILFQLSGSIACFKACDAISKLVQLGHEVQCVATHGALEFVGTATLEGLTGRRVMTEVFEKGEMMDHISLTRWADIIVTCPASANSINRLAAGLGDDLLGSLFLASPKGKRHLLFPSMNKEMLSHPIVERSLRTLSDLGVQVMPTGQGALACGERGGGRLLEVPEIIQAILGSKGRRILITAGGTREAIDEVRSICNMSSGQTAARIAEAFARSGDQVTYVHAATSALPDCPVESRPFDSVSDLQAQLKDTLGAEHYDIVIHAAAVSDYTIEEVSQDGKAVSDRRKLDSGGKLLLALAPAPKLVQSLRKISKNPGVKIVAFKLTSHASPEERGQAVEKLESAAKPDLIVHNDLTEVTPDSHVCTLYKQGKIVLRCHSKKQLGTALASGEHL